MKLQTKTKKSLFTAFLVFCIVIVNTFTAVVLANHFKRETKAQADESRTETEMDIPISSTPLLFGEPDKMVITYGESEITILKGSEEYELILMQNEYRRLNLHKIVFHNVNESTLETYLTHTELNVSAVSLDYIYNTPITFSSSIFIGEKEGEYVYDSDISVNKIKFYIDIGPNNSSTYFIVYENSESKIFAGLWSNEELKNTIKGLLEIQ